MSEWIESHVTLPRHRKFRKLARLLESSTPETLGYLHLLWYYAMEFAPDGCLDGHSAEDIAEACYWVSDAQLFVDALVESGWLDRTEDGLVIHDWDDYNRLHRERQKAAARQAELRERRRQQLQVTSCHSDESVTEVPRNSDVTVTSPLRHSDVTCDQTRPDQTIYTTTNVVDGATPSRKLTKEDMKDVQALVAHYVDCAAVEGLVVTSVDKGRLGKYIKEVRNQGVADYVIKAALERLVEKRLGPHLLGQICNEVAPRAEPDPEEYDRLVAELTAKAWKEVQGERL